MVSGIGAFKILALPKLASKAPIRLGDFIWAVTVLSKYSLAMLYTPDMPIFQKKVDTKWANKTENCRNALASVQR